MKLIVAVTIAAVGLAAAAAFAGVERPEAAHGTAAQQRPANETVTVTGTGEVEAVPDEAQLSLGVNTNADTAREAMEENAERMRRVILALREAGIAERDIRTEEVSLSPRYREETLDGYTASNTVAAKSGIGELVEALDAAVSAGANHTYGLSLVNSKRDELYRKALADAVGDARSKAEALAAAGGFGVGDVVRVEEGASEPPVLYDSYAPTAMARAAKAPIEPGTNEIAATIQVTFAIR